MKRLENIKEIDNNAMKRSQERWNSIAKPLHSLGLLEDAIIRISGITGNENVLLDYRCVVDMCADNGVVCEGVTQTDSSVTCIVAKAMAKGTSNINHLAKLYSCDVIPVDIGMFEDASEINFTKKISKGTNNIAKGSAMTIEQAKLGISIGIDMVRDCSKKGYKIICTGEMGIGNTTTSSAIASILLNMPACEVTGKGAGLDDEGLKRKINVINRAIEVNQPNSQNPIELLAKLGGYDIAGIVGLFLGGAIYRVPIVIDGFISAVSAALAVRICPRAKDFMLCSHVSKEPAGAKLLGFLGLQPLITAQMCLGEGTGAIMLLPLLDGALSVYNSSHKFECLPMERYEELC